MRPDPKQKTLRSPRYRAWIRKQPCAACGNPKSQHHHEPIKHGGGVGMKGPDDQALPLCQRCHYERHKIGRKTFYQIYNINWRDRVKHYRELYLKQGNTL